MSTIIRKPMIQVRPSSSISVSHPLNQDLIFEMLTASLPVVAEEEESFDVFELDFIDFDPNSRYEFASPLRIGFGIWLSFILRLFAL